MDDGGPGEAMTWIDERKLGRFIGETYGSEAEGIEIHLVKFLVDEGLGDLYRRERYRDGVRIGPDLKVPLETAALVLEVFAAAHHAALRAMARYGYGLEHRYLRTDDLLDLILAASCDPPSPEPV